MTNDQGPMKTLLEVLEDIGRVVALFCLSVVVGAGLTCGFFVGVAIAGAIAAR